MRLSIVVPSIVGREADLARTIISYDQLTPIPIEWIVERGHSTCGAAWNAGASRATGDILHMAADDLEPEGQGWLPAALTVIEDGAVPLGWVREDWGTFGRDFCRVPVCRREWWRDIPEIHYYSDNAFDDHMRAAGHLPTIAEGFDFYHRRSMIGRDDSPERVEHDREIYERAMSGSH